MEDIFTIANKNYNSRLIVGTGKYKNLEETARAVKASGADIVTVAVRRVNILDKKQPVLMDYLDPKFITYLPNTAGCYSSEEALRTLRLAREMGGWRLVKLEVLGDKKTLYPNMIETIKSTEVLVKEGFEVMVYCTDDPILSKKVEDVGACAIMPLGAPIGSGLGIQNKTNIKLIKEQSAVPVIVDAGVGTASDATIAMELGCDGVLINTAAGGGGKGMKVVNKPQELEKLFSMAKLEGKKYFNNDKVYIEKYFENPRHIEVQILSGKNRTVHLNERDCSVQRKHQKLIEETPSPVIDKKIRSDLLNQTVKMVENIGYEGAGTVEYIYENGKFYFLEMNTRIQVEHPVTEVATGIDIVKQQIAIANTGNTDLTQEDVKARGHAVECRINAEDPSKNFQPSPGIISVCHQPSGFRTRVDGAIFQGCKITPYYDSLICKLICHGRNRTEAIQRMLRSLDEFVIEGIKTTINLHKKILVHEKFLSSDFDVNWLVKEKFY